MKKPSSFVLRSGFQNFPTANKCIVQSCFAGCKRRLSSARKINSGDWQAHYLCLSAGCCLTSMKTTDGNASLISQLVAVLSFVIRLSRSCKEMQKKESASNCPSDMLTDNRKLWHSSGPRVFYSLEDPRNPKKCIVQAASLFCSKKNTKKQYKINESY